MKTSEVSGIPKFRLLFFLGNPIWDDIISAGLSANILSWALCSLTHYLDNLVVPPSLWIIKMNSILLLCSSISQLSYIQRVRRQSCLVWLEEKIFSSGHLLFMSFVRSWSSAQCGNQPQGKVLWRSWLCDVHSAGKDNTWLKRQSSWPILRDQQSFQTEFDPYASPYRCYTHKICVLPLGWQPLKRDPPTSFDDQTRPNQLLHQYSLFTTTLWIIWKTRRCASWKR